MLLIILVPVWAKWLIGIALGVFLFWLFSKWINWYIKKGKREDALLREEKAKREAERQLTLGPSDFYSLGGDLFFSEKNKNVSIRIINFSEHKKNDKDKFIFASSLSYHFTKEDESLLLLAIPQLVSVSSKNHDLIIEKSAAVCMQGEIRTEILKYLFIHLNKIYAYMIERQKISISKDRNNEDCLCVYLRIPLKYHLWLRERLLSMEEILSVDDFSGDDKYNFAIYKKSHEKWEDTLPFIKGVIADYFKAGVEFSGFSINKKIKRIMKKILLVTNDLIENEGFILELMKKHHVEAVNCIEASLHKLKKPEDFSLVVVEVSMPCGDLYNLEETNNGCKTGIVFFEKELKKFGIPVIFWSWSDEYRDEISELEGGSIIFVKKDADEDHLLIAVNEFVENM